MNSVLLVSEIKQTHKEPVRKVVAGFKASIGPGGTRRKTEMAWWGREVEMGGRHHSSKPQKELTGNPETKLTDCRTELRHPGGSGMIEGDETAPEEILFLISSSFMKLQ